MSSTSGNKDTSTTENTSKNPTSESPLSRDDVKAQREAKKAAKAARKSKSGIDSPASESGSSKSKQTQIKGTPTSSNQKSAAKEPKAVPPKVDTIGTPKPNSKVTPAAGTPKSDKSAQSSVSPKNTIQKPSVKTPISAPTSPDSPVQLSTKPDSVPKTPVLGGKPELDSTIKDEISELHSKDYSEVDTRFKELGMMYSTKNIRGSNQRTLALLKTVKKFVKDYRTPEGKGFKQDISAKLQCSLEELKRYRPFAVGMTSAVDGLNGAIRGLEEGLGDDEYRDILENWCDTFIEEKVEKAMEAIAQKGCEKIEDGDTILVFSLTDVIFHLFKLAGEMGKKFKLLLAITNSDTYIHDYKQLKKSMGADVFKENISVSCINISSIMSFISSVDKVFLGGHALFTTGGVMAHAGSSTIALCAIHHNIPTLFFCETYKFCDKSPTDAFYYDVFSENKFCFSSDTTFGKTQPRPIDSLDNDAIATATIRYDVTPENLVTCVITDIDMLPSSSVPVILRVQENRPLTKCLQ